MFGGPTTAKGAERMTASSNGVLLSTFAMPSISGGKIQRVGNPILLWESLARPGDRRATTMPADAANKKPQVGDPLVFEVAKEKVAIGRVDGDVQIDDQTISRVHCTLQQ